MLVASLLAASCAGDRPTLTDELLVDSVPITDESLPAASDPSRTVQDASEQADPTPNADQPDVAADQADQADEATDTVSDSAASSDASVVVERLRVVVEETFPHDPTAFTQGLEFFDGSFIESTGLYEQSDLRRVDIATGDVLAQTPTPDGLFAEGLTRVEDRLIQLTWKAGKAYVWNAQTLELIDEFDYEGQGWGLCFNGDELVMTDGSANLTFRNRDTFEQTRVVPVLLNGEPVAQLNEVECVNADIYINVWMTDTIVRVNQLSGQVNAVIDASDLAQPRPEGSNVLNGIAYDRTNDAFYLTGKLWPTVHRVRFVLDEGAN